MKPDNISFSDWQILQEKYQNIEEVLVKLNNHYPIQYLIGDVEFLNTKIKVDERVLIPRYETEELVDKTLKLFSKLNIKKPRILELGTGSGCISIAIKKNYDCYIYATDISQDSLELAISNAKLNNTDITFSHEDIKDTSLENYDVLISNPPYVSFDEEVGLETTYEPQNAIYAQDNGLYYYKLIIQKLINTINKPKIIIMEIGYKQGQDIIYLVNNNLHGYTCNIEKDLSGKNRFAFIIKD